MINRLLSGKIIHYISNKVFMIFVGFSALNLEYNTDSLK